MEIRVFPQEEHSTTRRVRIYGSTRQSVEEAFSELQYVTAIYSLRRPEAATFEHPSRFPTRTSADSLLRDLSSSASLGSEVPSDVSLSCSPYWPQSGNSSFDTASSVHPGHHHLPSANTAAGKVSEEKGASYPSEDTEGLPVWIQPAGEDEHRTLSKFGTIRTFYAPLDNLETIVGGTRSSDPDEDPGRRQVKPAAVSKFSTTMSTEQQVDVLTTELRRRGTVLRQIVAASGLLSAWLDERTQSLTLYGLRRVSKRMGLCFTGFSAGHSQALLYTWILPVEDQARRGMV